MATSVAYGRPDRPKSKLEYGVISQALRFLVRLSFWRAALVLMLCLAISAPAEAAWRRAPVPREFAGIVIDAKSGRVLYENNADELRYPASISKVMTLYILFQELAAGRLKLSTMIPVSAHAAGAEPTKLGLRPGSSISVQDAIKSIVTISANDMARAIAEQISGSEDNFGKRMTATARALGMSHTTYVNASGLPDSRQITTVRDQARLGIAIYEHFPQYYDYFQTRSFTYGRRVYGNHNRLIGYNGVDGIKTGYTSAAGFNLLTASRLSNRHIVIAGFGFASGGVRDATVRGLVIKYLPQARQGNYLQTAMIPAPGGRQRPTVMVAKADEQAPDAPTIDVAVAKETPVVPAPRPGFRQPDDSQPEVAVAAYAPDPAARPDVKVATADQGQASDALPMDIGVRPAVQAASLLGEPTRAPKSLARPDVTGQFINDTLLGAPPSPLGTTRASTPLVRPVGIGDKGQPIDLMTSGGISTQEAASAGVPPTPVASVTSPPPAGGWIVQIGASPSQDGANQLLSDASGKIKSLIDLRPYVERFERNGQTFYRARFIGFGDRDQATGVCDALKRAKMSCLAMQG